MSNRILLNIGFGNTVTRGQVLAIVQPASAPIKRFVREKREAGQLVDVTMGKKVRAVVVTIPGTVFLSAISAASLAARLEDPGVDAPPARSAVSEG